MRQDGALALTHQGVGTGEKRHPPLISNTRLSNPLSPLVLASILTCPLAMCDLRCFSKLLSSLERFVFGGLTLWCVFFFFFPLLAENQTVVCNVFLLMFDFVNCIYFSFFYDNEM